MIKNILLILLLAFAGEIKAQTVVLNAPFKDFTTADINIPETPEGYEGWIFHNCKTTLESDGVVRVQVGTESEAGYILTPELTGLSGNARISLYAQGVVAKEVICVNAISDEEELYYNEQSLNGANTWYQLATMSMKGGKATTRLKITSKNESDGSKVQFLIANFSVTDIGDFIFHETFDKINETGGGISPYTGQTSTKIAKTSLDYIASDIANIYAAAQCIFFSTGSTYTAKGIPTPATNDVNVVFAIAGDNTSYGKTLTVKHGSTSVGTVTATKNQWERATLPINNFTASMGITFSGSNLFLDNIRVKERPTVSISQSAANETTLAECLNDYVNITLTRTLKADIWNTLCLPFECSIGLLKDVCGTDLTVNIRRFSSVSSGVFRFIDGGTIPAGEPFLIQVSKDIVNPTFRSVQIETATPRRLDGGNGFALQGVLSPTTLNTDGTHLFLGTDGMLYTPASGTNTINGMRCYFVVPEGASPSRIAIEDEAAGIATVSTQGTARAALFDLQGRRLPSAAAGTLPKGIYLKDGKKILIK